MLMCDLFELYQECDMIFATFVKLEDLFTFSTWFTHPHPINSGSHDTTLLQKFQKSIEKSISITHTNVTKNTDIHEIFSAERFSN